MGVGGGNIVEVFNDYGSTYAMAYPTPEIKMNQTFMQFGYLNCIVSDVTTPWTDRNVVPYYKGTWAHLRRVGSVEEYKRTVSFKNRRYGTKDSLISKLNKSSRANAIIPIAMELVTFNVNGG